MKYLITTILTIWTYVVFGQIKLPNYKEAIDKTKNGAEIVYFKNGNKRHENNYLHGLLHGKSVYYYASGSKEKEGQFFKGIKTGLFRFWHLNGQLASEMNVINGEFDLKSAKYWDKKGIKVTEKEFKRLIEN